LVKHSRISIRVKKPTSTLHISAKIAAGVPIQEVKLSITSSISTVPNPSVAQLTMDDSDPFQGNRDFVLHYRLIGAQFTSGLLLFQGEDENFFLYMAQPPARVETEEIPTARIYLRSRRFGIDERLPAQILRSI
jgi:Ca-activated chloride channel family protein